MTLTFDANKVTPAWMDEVMVRLANREIRAMADALGAVISEWDVTEAGAPFPPTSKNIAVLSFDAVNSLYLTVCEASGPSSAEGNASPKSADSPPSAISSPVSENSPNGSATEPSPTPSASLSST